MADAIVLCGFVALLAFGAYRECRGLAPSLCEPSAAPAELLARGENSPALFDFDDIAWDWFPERKAS